MGGFNSNDQGAQNPQKESKIIMSFSMQEVVANLMCKLMEAEAFEHLRRKTEEPNILAATGDWKVGEKATKKLIEWCQDQWRRKNPVLPSDPSRFGIGEPMCVPLYGQAMPLCHKCGTPCADCRAELELELPQELSSATCVLDYETIHQADNPEEMRSETEHEGMQVDNEEDLIAAAQPARMKLRSQRER